ncbi:hypothetical protein [Curtobacterium sp. MCBD17_040]|uniref:hypothetical protein n=1 Tax=Curtobacterium sp. MCBD17_040 TaxID=2175674 RepID=UPI000DA96CD9|nr:hypothetical protein [Curtobacterium sp. MCBD17_040]WIB65420.1 hypothetical protein DEI94_18610 [Curtobacterium sp. MCBD17_040]
MTDDMPPYLARMVRRADADEAEAAERFRAAHAAQASSTAGEDAFLRSSLLLLTLAKGREEYAKNAPEPMRTNLLREVETLRQAAQVFAGDGRGAEAAVPSWLWPEFERQAESLGLRLEFRD